MSVIYDICNQVQALLQAKSNADGFALPITPEVRARLDTDVPAERLCVVVPAGFGSERADRGGGRNRTWYVDICVLEQLEGNPNTAEAVEWFEPRALLIEQLEETDFTSIAAATFEESSVVTLVDQSEQPDDSLFLQIVRLEFSDP